MEQVKNANGKGNRCDNVERNESPYCYVNKYACKKAGHTVGHSKSKKFNSKINVTMIHGSKDEVVPQSYSKKVLKIFNKAKKKETFETR